MVAPNPDGRRSAEAATAGDTYVSELRLSHFRSFGPEVAIKFRPGFNVIIGANGTGKSNSLDAMLFAAVQDTGTLRVKSWTELANTARAGPTAVRLTISRGGDAPFAVLAHAKPDGARTFRLGTLHLSRAGLVPPLDLLVDRIVSMVS